MSNELRLVKKEPSGALERVVEAAVRMEQHDEVDRWEFSYDVLEAVDDLAPHQNGFDAPAKPTANKPGFNRAVDAVNDQRSSAFKPAVRARTGVSVLTAVSYETAVSRRLLTRGPDSNWRTRPS